MKYPTLDNVNLLNKKVLLRAGFDVHIEDGVVQDETRIEAILPTMRAILDGGASLILLSHQGRPNGTPDLQFTQKPLVPVLEKLLNAPVKFAGRCVGQEAETLAAGLRPGEVLLLENLRFEPGEKSKDESKRDALGKQLAALGDVFVNDAFTNCHRAHASMTSVPKFMAERYMGFNVKKEIEGLSKAIENPGRPLTLIISGLKMETKVPVIRRFLTRGDDILVGGGVANTFLLARGFDIGSSKSDEDFIEMAQELMLESEDPQKAVIHIPRDAVTASQPKSGAEVADLPLEDVGEGMAIFDIGAVTTKRFTDIIAQSKTIVWNGPLGMYELEEFSHGTKAIAQAVRSATEAGAVSILGGGDTLDFHEKYGYSLDAYTFVSTAGGAMLDFISGKELPGLKALQS